MNGVMPVKPKVLIPTDTWNAEGGRSPQQILQLARMAEQSGLDGIFTGDHVTFYGVGNDALMNLHAVAAVTERLMLMSCVYLLPLRHPTPVALQCAMLDQMSGGRLVLGVGIGGEDPNEFWACGVDPATRGARTNESMQILRSLWTQDETTFRGKHFSIENVRMRPRPVSDGGVPMIVGGRSDAALKRAGRYGDGWIGIWNSPRRMAEARERVREFATEAGRPDHPFQFGLQVWCSVDDDEAKARERVSRRMEGFYKLPFESFERYVPYGSAEKVAEFLAAHVEAGCGQFNLVLVQESGQDIVEAGLQIKESLATHGRKPS